MSTTSNAGILFVIAVVAAIVITGAVPDASRSAAEIGDYFVAHRSSALAAAWLGVPIVALFMLFATGVCEYLVSRAPGERAPLRWAWAGALLSSAALLIASAIQGVLAYERRLHP